MFLDKAAVMNIEAAKKHSSTWTLTPITHVEETKQILKLIPVLFTTFIPGIITAQSLTLFIKQGVTLDRRLGPHFTIPPACLHVFLTLSMLATIILYDRCFVPLARRFTLNPRGITLLQRLGVGLVLHVLISLAAFSAERKRLHALVREEGGGPRLTVFVLLPQFALMGVAEAFLEIAKQELFYEQAPPGMKSLGASFFTTSKGVGCFLSSVVLTTVSDISKRNGRSGWVLDDLNVSHLDYYYAFLAVLAFLNFVFFLVVAKLFVYNVEAVKK